MFIHFLLEGTSQRWLGGPHYLSGMLKNINQIREKMGTVSKKYDKRFRKGLNFNNIANNMTPEPEGYGGLCHFTYKPIEPNI